MSRLASLALVIGMVWLVLWPNPLADGALGHPQGDLADHYWGTWWFGERLLQGESPLLTHQTHLPEGGALWHPDPLGGLLGLALRPFGFPLAWNLLVTLRLLAAAILALGMGQAFTGRPLGGVVAAVVVAASPYEISLIHSGLSEYQGLALPLLCTWVTLRSLETGERPALVGLLMFAATAQSFYYGAFALLFALCGIPGRGWADRAATMARAFAVWALLALPWMAVAWSTLHGDHPAFSPEQAPGWSFAELPATDLMSWLRPGAWYHPDTPALGNPGILHVNYLGWGALLLGIFGVFRDPRSRSLLPHAAIFGAFALGPVLSWNRVVLRVLGVTVLLPMALFYLPGSPLRFVHHPYRIDAFVLPFVALFVAAGACALPRWIGALVAPALLAEALLASPAPWPIARAEVPDASLVAELPGEGAVLDWPPDATSANRAYLMAQVQHHRPIAAGVNTFLSTTLLRDPLVAELVRALDRPMQRARNRDVPPRGPVVLTPSPGESQLTAYGFAWIVLHERYLSSGERARAELLLQRALGEPQLSGPDVQIYALQSSP